MSSGHHHEHSRAHASRDGDFGRAFAIGIALNLLFVAGEAAAGLIHGSMALLADAGHNLSDVLGLVVAWGGATLARRQPTKRFTYGLRGSTILAALFNALFLLAACGAIALGAVQRFFAPQPVAGGAVAAVAAAGILVNGATAMLFARGRHRDLNIRGAYLHMAADAAVSAGVAVSGLVILWTGALWIDPTLSLIVVGIIFWSTWGLLRESVAMSVAGVPPHIDRDEVEAELAASPGVARIHHLHIWPTSTTEVALTAHLVMPAGHPGDAFFAALEDRLGRRFGIGHITLQIEKGEGDGCDDASADCG